MIVEIYEEDINNLLNAFELLIGRMPLDARKPSEAERMRHGLETWRARIAQVKQKLGE